LKITEFNPHDVRFFTSLKGKGGYFTEGIFIAEGPKIVPIMLRSSRLQVHSGFMTEEYYQQLLPLIDPAVPIYVAPKAAMEKIVGYDLHQGVMLAVRIPPSLTIEEAVAWWRKPALVLALDSIADAENMGSLIRNAAAFGCDCVLVDEQSCNPFLRRSVRVSMGTIAEIEIVRVKDLAGALKEIRVDLMDKVDAMHRHARTQIIGAVLDDSAAPLFQLDLTQSTVFVLGAEGTGIRASVLAVCDSRAIIPMAKGIDSLNVSVASSVFLYETVRQRALLS
jgi:23S rRNA (guanosine2251-2'-O)-methyltransferase